MELFSAKKIEHLEKIKLKMAELIEDKQQYRKEMQKLLIKNDKLENENKELKKDVKILHDRIARIDDYKKSVVHDKIQRIREMTMSRSKSPSQSNGGKSKKNKFRRSKYRITKRKY